MKEAGRIVLVAMPNTDFSNAKVRPALLLKKLPGNHDDWLICLISSKLHQQIEGFDLLVNESDSDFIDSGLKQTSLIRISRLAVVNETFLPGAIGRISTQKLAQVKENLSKGLIC